jgi:nucleoside-diphosphate-sugar epimerase
MRILVTGHNGYIGAVMVPFLQRHGHHVTGLDTYFFEDCEMAGVTEADAVIRKDIREVRAADMDGFDAVFHLAGLSNDPMGNLNPQITYDINAEATLHLGQAAKAAGVARFAFASSCSIYGAASPADVLDESAAFNPVTPYGESKVRSEAILAGLADDSFSPVYLRNATAYGASPKLRADLMVNSLVGYAFLNGEVLIKSDGTPWRPLVHIEDISRAFLAALTAPREVIHNAAFNIGRSSENYQVREVAAHVERLVPGSRIVYEAGGGPDTRCYRVDFSKAETGLPGFDPQWTVPKGIEELLAAYRANGLTMADFEGSRFIRLKTLQDHMARGALDPDLFWTSATAAAAG